MKYIILLIASYVLAFSLNLMPAIKHPDLQLHSSHLLVTVLFMFLLSMNGKKGSKKMLLFSLIGAVAGILVFIISRIEQTVAGDVMVDVIISLQYPLYLIFITPVFGLNLLFDLSYELFALLMSLYYGVIFGLTLYSIKIAKRY